MHRGVLRCTEVTEGCVEVHGGVCGCAEVHGQMCSGTWRCAEVHRGMSRGVGGTEVCRGEQEVTEVHRCM